MHNKVLIFNYAKIKKYLNLLSTLITEKNIFILNKFFIKIFFLFLKIELNLCIKIKKFFNL